MLLSKKKDLDLTNGPLFKTIILFALPIMLANVVATLFNAADMMVLSWFAKGNEIASVGATSSVISLFTQFAVGLWNIGPPDRLWPVLESLHSLKQSTDMPVDIDIVFVFRYSVNTGGLPSALLFVLFQQRLLIDKPHDILPSEHRCSPALFLRFLLSCFPASCSAHVPFRSCDLLLPPSLRPFMLPGFIATMRQSDF
jgi:hypothetical protein